MPPRKQGQYVQNMAYAAFAGQAGCSSTTLVIAGLICGLWIDAQLGTKPFFTITLMVLSVPLSLYVMVRMVLGAVKRITPPSVPKATKSKLYHDGED